MTDAEQGNEWGPAPQLALRIPLAATLVLTGTEDGVVDPRNSDLLAEHVSDARLERFEGTGHLFFWEEPDAFVASVTRFLEDRPS